MPRHRSRGTNRLTASSRKTPMHDRSSTQSSDRDPCHPAGDATGLDEPRRYPADGRPLLDERRPDAGGCHRPHLPGEEWLQLTRARRAVRRRRHRLGRHVRFDRPSVRAVRPAGVHHCGAAARGVRGGRIHPDAECGAALRLRSARLLRSRRWCGRRLRRPLPAGGTGARRRRHARVAPQRRVRAVGVLFVAGSAARRPVRPHPGYRVGGRPRGNAAYEPAFLAMAALSVLAAALAVPVHDVDHGPVAGRPMLQFPRKSWPFLLKLWAANSVYGVAVGFVGPFLTYWFYRRYGAGPGTIGLLYSFANALGCCRISVPRASPAGSGSSARSSSAAPSRRSCWP